MMGKMAITRHSFDSINNILSFLWGAFSVIWCFGLLIAARIAITSGAAGIIVSNHGARQLDYVPATIVALEEVLDTIAQ